MVTSTVSNLGVRGVEEQMVGIVQDYEKRFQEEGVLKNRTWVKGCGLESLAEDVRM